MVPEITHTVQWPPQLIGCSRWRSAVSRVSSFRLSCCHRAPMVWLQRGPPAHLIKWRDSWRVACGLDTGSGRGCDPPHSRRHWSSYGAIAGGGAEADRELSAHLAFGPNTAPYLRTLLRLRHDIVMIGRAAIVPLPHALGSRLASPLAQVAATFADYLRSSGAALLARRAPPSLDAVEFWLLLHMRIRRCRAPS